MLFVPPMKIEDTAAKKKLPRCPSCAQKFHHEAHSCPHCGFSFPHAQQKFGDYRVETLRINDRVGALCNDARSELKSYLAALEKKCPPLILAVHLPSNVEPLMLRSYSAWFLNSARLQTVDFDRRDLTPEWMLALVVDVVNKAMVFTFGYKLDPFLKETDLNAALNAGAPFLLEDDLEGAIKAIMKKAVRLLIKSIKRPDPWAMQEYKLAYASLVADQQKGNPKRERRP